MVDETLAKSFERIGADYDRYRPGFPPRAAELLTPAQVGTALDLGAGTGKFTELLVDRAQRVVAVEPSEPMLAVLRAKLPLVEAHVGSAEQMPLESGSVDVVTVAQAFHWFDRESACAEIVRVLAPGGNARADLESLRSDVRMGSSGASDRAPRDGGVGRYDEQRRRPATGVRFRAP